MSLKPDAQSKAGIKHIHSFIYYLPLQLLKVKQIKSTMRNFKNGDKLRMYNRYRDEL